jgi:nicotinamide mononucleotide transporter
VNWIELTAVVFGIASVVLTIRQSLWCWPTGLVQVALYVCVFFAARLYSDVVLHVVYVALQIYGWRQWLRGSPAADGGLPVSTLSTPARAMWIVAIAVVAVVWGAAMARYTDAAAPHADAFIAAASLAAQYLLARKRLENWLLWIVVDVVAIAVYWTRGLQLTAGLYAIFLALAAIGLRTWLASLATTREATAGRAA